MNPAKQEILGRVQRALGRQSLDAESEYAAIARAYRQEGTLDSECRLNLFAERLQDYDAVMHRCLEENVAGKIAQVLASRNKRRLLVARDVPASWRPEGFNFVEDQGLRYSAIDHSEGVLTTCAVAIAVTGTIVLRHSSDEGRRALSLIPDYHLCIVRASQLVETVPEGIRIMRSFDRFPITTISGPSATSDIEMTRIKGVHGPRTLEVVFVTSEKMFSQ
jgi:L-lactate dehydrogenase complex protein LldG